MKKEMLINVLQPEECRIAIVEDGVLEELYVERASQESYVGNIYKGRIVNIEPSIQAVFVDFGIGRNGFLHVSDVDPIYYKHLLPKDVQAEMEEDENGGGRPRGRGGDRGGDRRGGGRGAPRGGERRDRDGERGPRPVRVAEPESVVSAPLERPEPETPKFADEFADDDGFGSFAEGIDDAIVAPPPPREQPAPRPEPEARAPRPEVRAPRPAPTRPQSPPPVPAAVDEEGDFGAGVLFDDETPAEVTAHEHKPAAGIPPTPEVIAPPSAKHPAETESDDNGWPDVETIGELARVVVPAVEKEPTPAAPPEAEEPAESTAVEAEKPAAEPKAKGRPRKSTKAKAKADEPAEELADEAKEPEAKAKTKGKRPRKRAEGDAPADGDAPTDLLPTDEKPRPMGGAERRSTADDDEPEIKPFFDSGADDFDVDAPNDRFGRAGGGDEAEGEEAFGFEEGGDDEPAEPVVARGGKEAEVAGREDDAPMSQAEFDEEFAPRPTRKFNDEDEGDEDSPGGRGRGRGRARPPARRGPGGPGGGPGGSRSGPRDRGFPRPPIQEIFKRGQEVIVQVIKEGIGTKGPTLSTFISIAGRYLVLMPSLNRVGVSRKIEDFDARKRLREIMTKLNPPKGVGFIVRTAATDRNEKELQNDLAYLLRLWQVVARRIKKMPAPVEIYRESDMITRTIRDIFTNDIDTIWVDEPTAFAHASEFLQIVMPRFADRIRYFAETEPLFNKHRVDDEIAKINQKRIDLPQGGSIIIEQTEALVAIDVNSGNFRADNNAEETAYQMNLIAAREIARQLRLRDLGGVIVNDFIDMRSESHRRNVENALRTALERDRARTKILRISQFGIIEMTRQRIQPSLKKRIFNDCPHCKGTGYVKTNETMSIEVMRLLQLAAHRAQAITSVVLTVHTEVAFYLLNRKRKEIAALEEKAKMEVQINGQNGVSPDLLECRCLDSNGNEVRLVSSPPPRLFRGPQQREFPDRRQPRKLD
nr:Rne/Rng family ribonuclease [Fimbriiglobus ruber]